ncbi:MAG TPA: penicillin acylase family protein [Pyrinomonadaceae bacterium]|nr:penicillin acylase family protein [Pyrinomonadaceae bacterium]
MKRSFAARFGAKSPIVLLLILSVSASLPLASSHSVSQTPAAPKTSTVQLAGLTDRVTIRRDERGIPYIEAKNDEDLYFAQGFVTASDRLWQMDLGRRSARGELAEVLGSLALEEDKRHRRFGFAQVAEAELAQASLYDRKVLEAYAKGVNAYIASLDSKSLPPEFQILQYKPRPWTAADSLTVPKLFFETLSTSWRLDIMRDALSGLAPEKLTGLLPVTSPLDVLVVGNDTAPSRKKVARRETLKTLPDGRASAWDANAAAATMRDMVQDAAIESRSLARVGLYAEGLAASNNWVASGKRTVSGKPLLANDPHLAPSAPPIWYMVHLSAPGIRVAGVTAGGIPGVVIGHNERITWGFTNVGPDVQDLYLEKFDPDNPRRYMTPGGWRDAEVRREQIKVRKNFVSTDTSTVDLDVTVTRNGPVIYERAGKRYALRWTAIDPKLNKGVGLQSLNRAGNWKEFTAAISDYTGATQNMVYADVDGNIGYYAAGVIPIRKSGDGSIPYDGSSDAGEWTSFIPFKELPHVFNPPSGLIITANQRIVGTSYPHFLTHSWAQPYRAKRISDLLNKKPKLNADDFRATLGDVYSIAGVIFTRQASKILRGQLTPADDGLRKTLAAMNVWDGQLKAESTVAPIVTQMRIAFRTRIINAAIGNELARSFGWSNFDTTLDRILTEQSAAWLPPEFKTYAELLRACHADARQALSKSLGEDESKWTWGNMVKSRFPHPLSDAPLIGLQFTIPPFPQNGTPFMLGATVNVGAAVSMRLIADPGDWDRTQHGITLGQSGLPSSPHWKDQLDDWRSVTPRVFPFSEAAVAKATKEIVTLEPKK